MLCRHSANGVATGYALHSLHLGEEFTDLTMMMAEVMSE